MPKHTKNPSKGHERVSEEDSGLTYTTYDLGVSAALLTLGYRLCGVDKENPRKAMFIFGRDEGIEDCANEYFADQLEVKARSLFDAIKAVKNLLYSE